MNRFISQPIIGHLAAVIITSRCQRGRRFALIKAAHYRFWTWLAFGLRVVGVTHDVWVRPICTKRVRFDHFLAGTRARRRRIQEGKNRNMVSCAAVIGGPPFWATRFLSQRTVTRIRAITSGPLRKLSRLTMRRASSRSSSGGNSSLCARRSAKIFSHSLSLLICLTPYFEGQGHWSDRWISSIRA